MTNKDPSPYKVGDWVWYESYSGNKGYYQITEANWLNEKLGYCYNLKLINSGVNVVVYSNDKEMMKRMKKAS